MKRLLILAAFVGTAVAQIPVPQLPLTGNIGAAFAGPVLNGGNLVMTADANYTMAYPDMSAFVIKVTSTVSLTATRNLISPNGFFSFIIENATMGGQVLQIIGTSGSGFSIPNGQVCTVIGDGTNYVSAGCTSGGGSGVSSINGNTGAMTFTGAGVTQSGNSFNFAGSAGAYVALSPTGSQTINQPTQTTLGVSETNSSYGSSTLIQNSLTQVGQGFDLGNGLTSTHNLIINKYLGTTRGNNQIQAFTVNNYAPGDFDMYYNAMLRYGGLLYGSDEGSFIHTDQNHQVPVVYGPLAIPQAGNLGGAFGAINSGSTYIAWQSAFPVSGPVASVSVHFPGTTTAGTASIGVVTLGPNNTATFSPSQVVTVTITAVTGAHDQVWTAGSTLPAISATAGQSLAYYQASGAGPSGTSINQRCLVGTPMPTTGTYTYTAVICSGSGYPGGIVMQGTQAVPTTGATTVNVSPVSTYGYFSYNLGPAQFSDSGIMIDATQQSSTYGTGTFASKTTAIGMTAYVLGTGTVPVSSAYGVLSGCSGTGNGESPTPAPVTCTVTPNVSPASGAFTGPVTFTGTTTTSSTTVSVSSTTGLVVGQTIIAQGLPYQDTIASIGTGSVVMTLAATSSNSSEAMQVSSDISTAAEYQEENVVTSVTGISGGTQTIVFTSIYPPTSFNSSSVGQGGMAGTAVTNLPSGLIIAWQVVASLPGGVIAVANCAVGGCQNAGGILPALSTVYFYPMAFVSGTNGGISGSAQLLPNSIPFVVADNLVGATSSEVSGGNDFIIYGKTTPTDFSRPDAIHIIVHDGPQGPGYDWNILDNGTLTGNTYDMMNNTATYSNDIFQLSKVPGNAFLQIGNGPITGFTGTQIAGVYGYGALRVDPTQWDVSASFNAISLTTGSAPPTACGIATGCIAQALHSASGPALPTCNASSNGAMMEVSDATSPTYMATYTSGGTITTAVICSYNGTAYAWKTH